MSSFGDVDIKPFFSFARILMRKKNVVALFYLGVCYHVDICVM